MVLDQEYKNRIEFELQHPRTSWTIDRYDGEDSFRELGLEPVAPAEAGKKLEPEDFQSLGKEFYAVEAELGELMDQEDMDN